MLMLTQCWRAFGITKTKRNRTLYIASEMTNHSSCASPSSHHAKLGILCYKELALFLDHSLLLSRLWSCLLLPHDSLRLLLWFCLLFFCCYVVWLCYYSVRCYAMGFRTVLNLLSDFAQLLADDVVTQLAPVVALGFLSVAENRWKMLSGAIHDAWWARTLVCIYDLFAFFYFDYLIHQTSSNHQILSAQLNRSDSSAINNKKTAAFHRGHARILPGNEKSPGSRPKTYSLGVVWR